ncbi:MAG: hypothetical protein ACK55Z_10640, partial [bacterium]
YGPGEAGHCGLHGGAGQVAAYPQGETGGEGTGGGAAAGSAGWHQQLRNATSCGGGRALGGEVGGGAGILLAKTRGEVVRMITKHGKGVVKDPEEKVDCLLMKVGGYEKVRVRSAYWKNMPESMLTLT